MRNCYILRVYFCYVIPASRGQEVYSQFQATQCRMEKLFANNLVGQLRDTAERNFIELYAR